MVPRLLFEPVGHNDTEDVEGELDGDELASGSVFRRFGCPDGDDGVQDAGTPTVDETSYMTVQYFDREYREKDDGDDDDDDR